MASARRIANRFVGLGSSSADPIVSPARRRIFRRGLASVLSVKGGLSTMSHSRRAVPHRLLPILILAVLLVHPCVADVGTAVQSDPPRTLTTCGYDPSRFSPSFLFAYAGDEIWDNGAACRRKYKVRCISGDRPHACRPVQWISVTIVEQASGVGSRSSSNGATMMLSTTAYRAIADLSAKSIKIEFER
ncbi:hypothetical protein EUGRSUZ_K01244 [Eucalyptus grandis]|uniref:Uncharacterized protein n=2 Tax=Eucalyptus grandis TaxID=71139 RepID=A0ACC3IU61_EUCGR|nr:hypothetical protein EUGRSUZ_K01244 [Eucalyptus grandis]